MDNANNYAVQAQNAGECVSSITPAKRKIKEHIAMVRADICKFSAQENYEMCAELQMVKKGLEYALEDVESLEVSALIDSEVVELPKPIFDIIQKLSASVDVNKDLVKITMESLTLCDATITAAHDALAALAGRAMSPMECHARIENLRRKFLGISREMETIIKKVGE